MKIETGYLQTIKNYAVNWGITTSYVYKLIRLGELEAVVIDGVQFININQYPHSPKKR